ncbi:MAG: hypoxanthine phosphoribosyltransferase [bacterium]|nr:hypoxanthine phosphoribosyltransferase [bacterium]
MKEAPGTGQVEFDGYVLEKLVSENEIRVMVQCLADEIHGDYHDRQILLVGILKGANVFLVDLMRDLGRGNPEIGRPPMPVEIDFMQVSSYKNEKSTGVVQEILGLRTEISDRDVILVEDILDTGKTLSGLLQQLAGRHPASLEVCVLLDKQDRREVPIDAKYCGMAIPDKFVVGYGLDVNEHLRNLPYIGVVIGRI